MKKHELIRDQLDKLKWELDAQICSQTNGSVQYKVLDALWLELARTLNPPSDSLEESCTIS